MPSQGSWVGCASTCPSDNTTSRGWSVDLQRALALVKRDQTSVKCQNPQRLQLACKVQRFVLSCHGEVSSDRRLRRRKRPNSHRECCALKLHLGCKIF